MASLDTNCLLRWVLNDLPEQAAAVRRIIQEEDSIDVADLALVEMAFVLEKIYKLDRETVSENIGKVNAQSSINCNRQLFEQVLPLYVKYPAVSFNDCCLAIYAKLNEATPLYTFDKKLDAQAPHTKLL